MRVNIFPLGDNALCLEFADSISLSALEHVQKFSKAIENKNFSWLIEMTTAYTTITIYYDILEVFLRKNKTENSLSFIKKELKEINISQETINEKRRKIIIPVCYDDCFSLDINEVAKRNNLSKEDVITLHERAIYTVAMIGFSPGFPFLLGLNKQLATLRKETPRLEVAAGSVGIAGEQTGIYPSNSPGGWQIIGRTPMKLFRPANVDPSLLKAGDQVTFKRITEEQFYQMENDIK